VTSRKRKPPYEASKDYGYRFKDPNADWRLTDSTRPKLSFAVVWPYVVISAGVALIAGSLIARC
jgi:hypothetical protein